MDLEERENGGEEEVRERLYSLCFSCVKGYFSGVYEVPEKVVLTGASRLREDLWLDDLGLEELTEFVNGKLNKSVCSVAQIEACQTFGDVVEIVISGVYSEYAGEVPEQLFPSDKMSIPSIWMREFRGQVKQQGPLIDVGAGYSKDDKLFARLRRTYRELKRVFSFDWKAKSAAEQRQLLYQVAPLPASRSDPNFPAALLLVPEMNVAELQGEQLLELLEKRAVGDFGKLMQADLQRARAVYEHFACPEYWEKKIMMLETRREIEVKSHKDEARVRNQLQSGQAIKGRLWGIYSALAGSVQFFLLELLEHFKKRHAASLKAKKINAKHSICDFCGEFGDKMMVCGRCKQRWYCSKNCQAKDWSSVHKKNCSQPSFALKFE
jgi:hypothetical protein